MDVPTASGLSTEGRYLVVNGNRFDTHSYEGRMAARAYAWALRAEGDEELASAILRTVGKREAA